MQRWARSVVLSVSLLLSAASQAMMAGAAPDSAQARVDANSTDSPWAGVVAVRVNGGVYSGVAVSPRHILTAAHVMGGALQAPEKAEVVLNFGADASHLLAVSQIKLFPGYSFPYEDLALLQLVEPLPEGVPTYAVNDLPLAPGSELSLVGYGGSGPGDLGPQAGSSATLKRVGWNALDQLSTQVDNSGRRSSFYLYDFDGPEGQGPMGGPSLGNARETMVAGGDSGSPAFVIGQHGHRVLAGINTFATPLNSARALNYSFGQGGGGIYLAEERFLNWLDEASGGLIKRASSLRPVERSWFWWLGGSLGTGGLLGLAAWQRSRFRAAV